MKYPIATLVATVHGRFVVAADLLVYLDQEFKFRVEYPAAWERLDTTGMHIRLMAQSKDGDTCFFDVGAAPKSKGWEPAKLVSVVLEGDGLQKLLRKSMPDAEVVSTQRTRLGNQDAAFMVFTATSEVVTVRMPVKGMGVLTWRNGYSYGGTCITRPDRYSRMETAFKGILGTFTFLQ
jgi:hypothetical protein